MRRARVGGQLCLLLALLYFTSYMTRLNFSASMAEMIARGVLTKPLAGSIGSALFFTYGFGQIVSGTLSDKFRPNRMICVGLCITAICNMLMPFARLPQLMCVVWGVNGFAQAMFWPPIVKLMAAYLDEDGYARGNWLVSVASHGATILIYVAVPACITFLDWRFAFFLASAWAVVCLAVFVIGFARIERVAGKCSEVCFPTPTAEGQSADRKNGRTVKRFLLSAPFICILMAVAFQGFLKDGIQSWMPTFFTEVFGMSASLAILSNVALPIFNIIMVSVVTWLYQRFLRNELKEALVLFGTSILFCLLLTLFFESSSLLCLLFAALITGSMHGINLMLISFLPRHFHRCGKVATVSGICNACSYAGSAISSYGIAMIAEKMGWQVTLLSWGLIGLCGVVLCLIALRPWTAFIRNADT